MEFPIFIEGDCEDRLTLIALDARSSELSGHGDPSWRYNMGSFVDGEICIVVFTCLYVMSHMPS